MSQGPLIERREPGESGVLQGRITDDRLEAIAVWNAIPASERGRRDDLPRSLTELSARLGVSPARVRAVLRTPRYRRVYDDVLRHVAEAMLPEVLYAQYKRAVECQDTLAARFIREHAQGESAGGAGHTFNLIQGNQITINNEESIREDEAIYQELERLARTGQLARRLLRSGAVEVEAEDGGPED